MKVGDRVWGKTINDSGTVVEMRKWTAVVLWDESEMEEVVHVNTLTPYKDPIVRSEKFYADL